MHAGLAKVLNSWAADDLMSKKIIRWRAKND